MDNDEEDDEEDDEDAGRLEGRVQEAARDISPGSRTHRLSNPIAFALADTDLY